MLRNVHLWLPGYLANRKRGAWPEPVHVIFCFVDHYEPLWGKPSREVARARVAHWREQYPKLAEKYRDADGRPPQHSWFYPAEEYAPEYLEPLAKLTELGLGEVEIHLHHRGDTAANLRATLEDFKIKLRNHGLLGSPGSGVRGPESNSAIAEGGGPESGVRSPESNSAPAADPENPRSNVQGPRSNIALSERGGPESGVRGPESNSAPAGPQYGFIHGNWALDNSRGDGDWCGVNNELQVLRETGCYADFTLPSAPSDTQTRKVNAIYYATDDPDRPKSHDTGEDVRVRAEGRLIPGDRSPRGEEGERTASSRPQLLKPSTAPASLPRQLLSPANCQPSTASASLPRQLLSPANCHLPTGDLLLIQGPLALNWRRRKWGVLPRIEAGNVAGHCRPSAARVDLWVRQRIGVLGRPDWIFVKVHTHGCQENNFAAVLDGALHQALARYNDGQRHHLHYVTAREMYNLVKAAEAGASGDPNPYRDFVLAPPPRRQAGRQNG